MQLDPAALPLPQLYRHLIGAIVPRPIAWVSTLSPGGVANLAPFSFFNGIGANPPALLFCPVNDRHGRKKDTLRNVEATGEFVVNVVPFALAGPMNASSAEYPPEESEFSALQIAAAESVKVKAPRVAAAPVQFECSLHTVLNLGAGPLGANVVIGRIVWLHIADEVLSPEGEIDPAKLDAIGRMGGTTYARTTERFDLPRPVLKK